jgi:hypothetical protein
MNRAERRQTVRITPPEKVTARGETQARIEERQVGEWVLGWGGAYEIDGLLEDGVQIGRLVLHPGSPAGRPLPSSSQAAAERDSALGSPLPRAAVWLAGWLPHDAPNSTAGADWRGGTHI